MEMAEITTPFAIIGQQRIIIAAPTLAMASSGNFKMCFQQIPVSPNTEVFDCIHNSSSPSSFISHKLRTTTVCAIWQVQKGRKIYMMLN